MFSRQDWQIKLVYASFGALILFIGMLLSPVTAQRDKFGAIECTSLAVVDADGKTIVRLGAGVHGGYVDAYDKDGQSGVSLVVTEHGGRVDAISKDGKSGGAVLVVTEHGGHVQVSGKGEGVAVMSINEYGNGAVFTRDKNGNPLK